MTKRIFALVIALVMVVSTMGVMAFATIGNDCPHHGFEDYDHYKDLGNGKHANLCTNCGGACEYMAAPHYPEGADVCELCGAEEKCFHAGNDYTYISNGDNTHSTVCNECGETIYEGAECYFEDGVCVACGAEKVETKPGGSTNGVPQTGDNANMILWAGLVVFGIFGTAAACVYGKKAH